ncbi:Hypothetical predicted protein [Paramuricea clavata]|uniref:Uncharacterized protein n=1 Tax=Paramuricea clavata TaxID=317549 RepID=A0A7D9DWX8_PARCT|nr:Hypothetical predicted protein [Paramuricea clavata]
MKSTEEVKFVNWYRRPKKRGPPFSTKPIQRQQQPCSNCGRTGVQMGKDCLAFGKKLKKCQKYNHFAAVCRSSKSDTRKGDWKRQDQQQEHRQQKSRGNYTKRKWQVKKTSEEPTDSSKKTDDEFFG